VELKAGVNAAVDSVRFDKEASLLGPELLAHVTVTLVTLFPETVPEPAVTEQS
jgi:hypothetical protein